MIEAIGLMGLGAVMLIGSCFGHYHESWKSSWRFAGWGLLLILVGGAMALIEIWW